MSKKDHPKAIKILPAAATAPDNLSNLFFMIYQFIRPEGRGHSLVLPVGTEKVAVKPENFVPMIRFPMFPM